MHPRHDHSVYAEGADARRRLRTALEGLSRIGVTNDWEVFLNELANVRSAAVYLPELNGHHAERIKRLRSDRPLVPLALITELNPANLKALNAMPECDDILLSSEIQSMPDLLQRIAGRGLLLEAAAFIETLAGHPPELVAALARACRRRDPVRTVSTLGTDILGADRKTLWRLWRGSAAVGTSPHDFIDWLLVAHAAMHRLPSEANRLVAKGLGVDQETLSDVVRRRFGGLSLEDITAAGRPLLLANLRTMLTALDK